MTSSLNSPNYFDISELGSYRRYDLEGSLSSVLFIEESPADWASKAGYKYSTLTDEDPLPTPMQDSFLARKSLEFGASLWRETLTNVYADDFSCLYWNWGVCPNLPLGEVLFIPVSKNNIALTDLFWTKHYPFLSNHSDQVRSVLLKYNGKVCFHYIDEDVFFLGGLNQEGTFSMHTIPCLMGIQSLGLNKDIPVVVGTLYPYQRKIIEALKLNFNFYQIAPPEPRSLDIVKCSNAHFSYTLNSRSRLRFIHECVAKNRESYTSPLGVISSLPRFFYFKRNEGENTRRVHNGFELEKALNAIGFISVVCENRDHNGLIALFSNAKLIVSDPGTPITNFCNYCPPECQAIWMMPEMAFNGTDSKVTESLTNTMFPCIDRLFILPGMLAEDVYYWQAPHIYPIDELLSQVKKMM